MLDLARPELLDDDTLARALLVLNGETHRRALERADLEALVVEGFEQGFSEQGVLDPWLHGGVLVAPGFKLDRSSVSHICSFVRVCDRWVWECATRLQDDIRYVPGPRRLMRSVTLAVVSDGDSVDVITSRMRNGQHELTGVRSYVVKHGALVLVSQRAVKSGPHR